MKAFGGRITITLADDSKIADELAVANAHSLGATPWTRPDYIRKFEVLTEGILESSEALRFLDVVQRLPELGAGELAQLTFSLPEGALAAPLHRGIFDWKI